MNNDEYSKELDARGIEPKFIARRTRFNLGKSIYRGCSWNNSRQRWQAMVRLRGILFFIGDYKDEEDAARAVDNFRFWTSDYSKRRPRLHFEDHPSLYEPHRCVRAARQTLKDWGYLPGFNHFPEADTRAAFPELFASRF